MSARAIEPSDERGRLQCAAQQLIKHGLCLSIKLAPRITFTDGLFSERLVNSVLNECFGLLSPIEPVKARVR
jgi:hypothetical protein